MLIQFQRFFISATLLSSATLAMAQESNPSAESTAEPMPKGYDESFQTGDIPRPNSPEMDPDAANEQELAPERSPDLISANQPDLDIQPGEWLFGGTASLTFPHIMNFSLESMVFQRFGISVNYGNITRNIMDVDVAMKHTDVRFRWFPWSGSFFAGVGFGQHEFTGELNRDVKEPTSKKTVASHGKLVASANYALPHFGWFAVWDSGLTLGCDFGYLIPFGPKSKFSASFSNAPDGTDTVLRDTNEYKEMKKDLEESAEAYASKPIPYATLIRLGWMF